MDSYDYSFDPTQDTIESIDKHKHIEGNDTWNMFKTFQQFCCVPILFEKHGSTYQCEWLNDFRFQIHTNKYNDEEGLQVHLYISGRKKPFYTHPLKYIETDKPPVDWVGFDTGKLLKDKQDGIGNFVFTHFYRPKINASKKENYNVETKLTGVTLNRTLPRLKNRHQRIGEYYHEFDVRLDFIPNDDWTELTLFPFSLDESAIQKLDYQHFKMTSLSFPYDLDFDNPINQKIKQTLTNEIVRRYADENILDKEGDLSKYPDSIQTLVYNRRKELGLDN